MPFESPVPPTPPLHVGALRRVPGGALLLGLEVGLPVRPLAVVRLQIETRIVARGTGRIAQTISIVFRKVVL